MPRLSNLLSLALILTIGLPFALFALVTTTLALFTLFLRGTLVYLNLALALLQTTLSPSPSSAPPRLPKLPTTTTSKPTPPAGPRDFETVGGWSTSSADAAAWKPNARLQLPVVSSPGATRHQRRSGTGSESGSRSSPAVTRRSGTASPEGYFSLGRTTAGSRGGGKAGEE